MNTKLLAIALSWILIAGVGSGGFAGELFKWVDKDGIIHLSDSPPQERSKTTKIERIITPENRPPASPRGEPKVRNPESTQSGQPAAPAQEPLRKVDPPKKTTGVEIFTTSWCSYCKQAIAYLKSKGIGYTEYDIEKDKDALRRKNSLDSSGGVPLALINGRIIRGFSRDAYDDAFGQKP